MANKERAARMADEVNRLRDLLSVNIRWWLNLDTDETQDDVRAYARNRAAELRRDLMMPDRSEGK